MKVPELIDSLTRSLGTLLAWSALLMVLATCAVVLLRYGMNVGSIALQESVMYLHGLLFMGALGYGLQSGAHVRVDLVHARLSLRWRTIIDLAGHCIFSVPLAIFIIWLSTDYVAASWRIMERSPEVGGIPAIWLLKTLIPVGAGLYGLQTIAEILRAIRRLRGLEPFPSEPDDSHETTHAG